MRPNIVFILMDDLGWKDLSCYGSEYYETPNLDRLAQQGMRFTTAYASCPVCSPSRASCLTGRYPARVGVTNYIDWSGRGHPSKGRLVDAPYINHLPLTECCVARPLKEAGYRTWHVGKWHLGGTDFLPERHGFDVNVGGSHVGHPAGGYFAPWKIPNVAKDVPDGTYLDDWLTDEAVKLIENNDDAPFFLNMCFYLVHTPIQGKEEDVERFRQKAIEMGLDKLKTFEDGGPHPTVHKRDKNIKRRLVQSDPVYAAMVWRMDENIGRLMKALDDKGVAENTIVIFTSDNGGLSTSEGSPTCNLPLIEGKGWMYEGGTRESLIVRWPGRVKAGTTCDVPVTSTDFYPTYLEAAGLPAMPHQHCDGESLVPLLAQTGDLTRDALFWHYPHYGNQGGRPGASVRAGDWKVIEFFEDKRVELYNLVEDPSEQTNLADAKPEKTKELLDRLHAWQAEVEALFPEANPDWKEAASAAE